MKSLPQINATKVAFTKQAEQGEKSREFEVLIENINSSEPTVTVLWQDPQTGQNKHYPYATVSKWDNENNTDPDRVPVPSQTELVAAVLRANGLTAEDIGLFEIKDNKLHRKDFEPEKDPAAAAHKAAAEALVSNLKREFSEVSFSTRDGKKLEVVFDSENPGLYHTETKDGQETRRRLSEQEIKGDYRDAGAAVLKKVCEKVDAQLAKATDASKLVSPLNEELSKALQTLGFEAGVLTIGTNGKAIIKSDAQTEEKQVNSLFENLSLGMIRRHGAHEGVIYQSDRADLKDSGIYFTLAKSGEHKVLQAIDTKAEKPEWKAATDVLRDRELLTKEGDEKAKKGEVNPQSLANALRITRVSVEDLEKIEGETGKAVREGKLDKKQYGPLAQAMQFAQDNVGALVTGLTTAIGAVSHRLAGAAIGGGIGAAIAQGLRKWMGIDGGNDLLVKAPEPELGKGK